MFMVQLIGLVNYFTKFASIKVRGNPHAMNKISQIFLINNIIL